MRRHKSAGSGDSMRPASRRAGGGITAGLERLFTLHAHSHARRRAARLFGQIVDVIVDHG
jgi:hypothetical protein